jgi:isochorismate synthase EntC
VCGSPRTAARAWLRATEAFDRGLYGGALGWIEEDRAEVHVLIRGVLLAGREVTAYAGCGLVLGSEAQSEWQETDAKLAAVCRRLGLSPPPTGSEA